MTTTTTKSSFLSNQTIWVTKRPINQVNAISGAREHQIIAIKDIADYDQMIRGNKIIKKHNQIIFQIKERYMKKNVPSTRT